MPPVMLNRPASGTSKPSGRPDDQKNEQRQTQHQPQGDPSDGSLLAGFLLANAREAAKRETRDEAHGKSRRHRAKSPAPPEARA
jgi:hypothetical protein